MSETSQRPQLIINYAPTLDLRIVLAGVQGLADVAPPEYCFERTAPYGMQ